MGHLTLRFALFLDPSSADSLYILLPCLQDEHPELYFDIVKILILGGAYSVLNCPYIIVFEGYWLSFVLSAYL